MDIQFVLRESNKITDNQFEEFYRLISQGLSRDEYRDRQGQKKLLSNSRYNILFAYSQDKIIGVMAVWYFDSFRFIEHFVIDNNYRNCGVGGEMLDYFILLDPRQCVLESEMPNSDINIRRIGFYQRHGFVSNDFEYYQLPLNEGDKPLRLDFMSYGEKLPEDKFQSIRKQTYTVAYELNEKQGEV